MTTPEGLPLLHARTDLQQARTAMLENRTADAKSGLRDAAHDLAEYGKLHQGPRVLVVNSLRQEIRDSVALVGRDRAGAMARISLWYDTLNDWYQGKFE